MICETVSNPAEISLCSRSPTLSCPRSNSKRPTGAAETICASRSSAAPAAELATNPIARAVSAVRLPTQNACFGTDAPLAEIRPAASAPVSDVSTTAAKSPGGSSGDKNSGRIKGEISAPPIWSANRWLCAKGRVSRMVGWDCLAMALVLPAIGQAINGGP